MDFVPRVSSSLFLSNVALQVTSLLMLYSHNCVCLVRLPCHLFSKGYSFSVFVVGCQLGFELVLQ